MVPAWRSILGGEDDASDDAEEEAQQADVLRLGLAQHDAAERQRANTC
jgi:hypothetical protein